MHLLLRAIIVGLCGAGAVSSSLAEEQFKDYTGPFPTQALYAMCKSPASREKCQFYLQGLMYGISVQKSMHDNNSPVCLPDMTPEQARLRVLGFIDATTGSKPARNKDAGDWIAFLALASGNLCKK